MKLNYLEINTTNPFSYDIIKFILKKYFIFININSKF